MFQGSLQPGASPAPGAQVASKAARNPGCPSDTDGTAASEGCPKNEMIPGAACLMTSLEGWPTLPAVPMHELPAPVSQWLISASSYQLLFSYTREQETCQLQGKMLPSPQHGRA